MRMSRDTRVVIPVLKTGSQLTHFAEFAIIQTCAHVVEDLFPPTMAYRLVEPTARSVFPTPRRRAQQPLSWYRVVPLGAVL
jgi:hypothetical protein